jgi:hypothetical protein
VEAARRRNDRLEITVSVGRVGPDAVVLYTEVRSTRIRRAAIVALIAVLAPEWIATPQGQDLPFDIAGHVTREEAFSSPVDPRIQLRFVVPSATGSRTDRLIEVTGAALRQLGEWFGPLPLTTLTVVDAPWNAVASTAPRPGVVMAATRWLSSERDGSSDRALIASIARQYWIGGGPEHAAFHEALARYSATLAMETILQGRQHWSQRFFGGFLPIAIRSMPLSPPRPPTHGSAPWFEEAPLHDGSEAARGALALYTLERYIGWPALQQALLVHRQSLATAGAPADLARIINEQGGRDLTWLFDSVFAPGARIDYGIEAFSSAPEGGRHRVRLVLRRYGDAVFAGTALPRDARTGMGVPATVTLADGTEIGEWWDGRDETREFEYLTATPAVVASVDANAILLVDTDRSNNIRRLDERRLPRTANRAIANWWLWLQDLTLAWSSLT